MSRSSPRWTIAELGRKVAEALAVVDYEGPANGQVRAIPNQRSIRYYTTLGLLDRPVEMRGRTALYGVRHLRQLVAIKRLQARGYSLAEVQESLTGASERKLAAIAQVPDAVVDAGMAAAEPAHEQAGPEGPAHRDRPSERAHQFWAALPPEHLEAGLADTAAQRGPGAGMLASERVDDDHGDDHGHGHDSDTYDSDAVVLASVALGRGVTLLVTPARALSREDTTAIRRAAAALMGELAARGICPSPVNSSPPSRSQAHTQAPADDRDPHQGDNHGASNRSHEQR